MPNRTYSQARRHSAGTDCNLHDLGVWHGVLHDARQAEPAAAQWRKPAQYLAQRDLDAVHHANLWGGLFATRAGHNYSYEDRMKQKGGEYSALSRIGVIRIDTFYPSIIPAHTRSTPKSIHPYQPCGNPFEPRRHFPPPRRFAFRRDRTDRRANGSSSFVPRG
jgi:hypothetical protein